MKEKTRFQRELERLAYRQILIVIVAGCMLFCAVVFVSSFIGQKVRQRRHMDSIEKSFFDIYRSVEGFLLGKENEALFVNCISGEEDPDRIRYLVSKYNLEAPVGIGLIITDKDDGIIFTTMGQENMNIHRVNFNMASVDNSKRRNGTLYTTVYYFSGDTSEYVLVRSLYDNDQYLGSVSAYLKGKEWEKNFSKYQYDTIITDAKSNIIYCSNDWFASSDNINKYKEKNAGYRWIGGIRYMTGEREINDPGIYIHSFIYEPPNIYFIMIGVLTILGLGIFWTMILFRLLQAMAAKTSSSVHSLVDEIRIIRKTDPEHVIRIETGDEIEEIAGQINKMITSIRDLNCRNFELAQINNRMELQNLQTQINPHFIYNTLENIRFLIAQDGKKADQLIEWFTHILRYSINNMKQNVLLQEDMEYIDDYLNIQKTRFGERFQYDITIQQECMRMTIPKLLLQPLLENSIKYGFKKKPSVMVSVRGWLEGAYMFLQVRDDGPGQPKIILESLKSILSSGQINTSHNGLQNINRRIILEYGKDSGLSVKSAENEGFTVTIKIWTGEEK